VAVGILLPTFAIFTEQGAGAIAAAAFPGFIAAFLLKMKEFAEFSAGPFRAKLKETIVEAESIRDELRELAIILAKVQVTSIAASLHSVFEGGIRMDDGYRLYEEIISSLKKLGVSDSKIAEVRNIYNREALSKYCEIITHLAIRDIEDNSVRGSLSTDMEKIRRDSRHRPVVAPSRGAILSVLSLYDVAATGIIEECLSDYLHLRECGVVRSPDRFTSGYRDRLE
jgi:hypothetical protein